MEARGAPCDTCVEGSRCLDEAVMNRWHFMQVFADGMPACRLLSTPVCQYWQLMPKSPLWSRCEKAIGCFGLYPRFTPGRFTTTPWAYRIVPAVMATIQTIKMLFLVTT